MVEASPNWNSVTCSINSIEVRLASPAYKERVWDLSIAREIVEAHSGTLRVESELGKGSRFTITLHAASVNDFAKQSA